MRNQLIINGKDDFLYLYMVYPIIDFEILLFEKKIRNNELLKF